MNGPTANGRLSYRSSSRRSYYEATSYYSADYFSARQRFLAAGTRLGLEHHALPIHAPSPNSESLTIDISVAGLKAKVGAWLFRAACMASRGFSDRRFRSAFLEKLARELEAAGRQQP